MMCYLSIISISQIIRPMAVLIRAGTINVLIFISVCIQVEKLIN